MARRVTAWWVLATLALATTVAAAEPLPVPAGKKRVRPSDLESPFGERANPCDANKSWPKLKACLSRGGMTVTVLHDLPAAKLVSVRASESFNTAGVSLFMLREGVWQRTSLYAAIGPTSDIVSFTRMQKETGYRLDAGSVMRSSASLANQTRVPIVLRRQMTTVCFDNGVCQNVFTACDALVGGKTYWMFRGTLLVDHGQVRVTGDDSMGGTVCKPPRNMFTNDPIGDPLE